MLTESFIAATLTANKAAAHTSAALKDVGIFLHELQPQSTFRHGYKKSSSQPGCVAVSDSHIFAAQADKAVVNVYSRDRGIQEATVPFPERVHSLAFARRAATLILGTEEGKLMLWEVATGRLTTTTSAHLQPVSSLCITPNDEYIISASADTSVYVWSLTQLLSFAQQGRDFGTEETSKAPVQTFSGHRTAITAAACGHAESTTNFVLTASEDGTCYLWHVETCQILRTLLLPTPLTSVTLDPADRVIYFGCKDGQIFSWDMFRHAHAETKAISKVDLKDIAPVQLTARDAWAAPTKDVGAANCLTLSYDGTSLLSGHFNGAIIQWDVAKHRVLNEIANLGQPVTNIEMLKPTGFPTQETAGYKVINVVKPNLELTSSTDNGTCCVPAKYNLNVMISTQRPAPSMGDIDHAITGRGIPSALLDGALRALVSETGIPTNQPSAPAPAPAPESDSTASNFKVQSLEEEVAKLKQQIAAIGKVEEKRKEKRLKRMIKRDNIDAKMREAYFEAVKKGKDGEAAMKKWQKQKEALDAESDEEYLDDKMDLT
ncbi:WD40 repeat-like protein, partial [Aureobasidium melanogenum]